MNKTDKMLVGERTFCVLLVLASMGLMFLYKPPSAWVQ